MGRIRGNIPIIFPKAGVSVCTLKTITLVSFIILNLSGDGVFSPLRGSRLEGRGT